MPPRPATGVLQCRKGISDRQPGMMIGKSISGNVLPFFPGSCLSVAWLQLRPGSNFMRRTGQATASQNTYKQIHVACQPETLDESEFVSMACLACHLTIITNWHARRRERVHNNKNKKTMQYAIQRGDRTMIIILDNAKMADTDNDNAKTNSTEKEKNNV